MTARIAVLSIALALASNLFLVAAVWRQTRLDALDAVRRETVEQSDALKAVWRSGGYLALHDAIDGAITPGDQSLLLAVVNGHGRMLVGNVASPLAIVLRPTPFRISPLARGSDAREVAWALQPIGPRWLLVARSLDLLAAQQRALERALAIAALLSLVLGVVAGLVLARFVARRLDRIAAVIDAAGEGDLSRRVGTAVSGGDAFDRLAGRLDAMLGKIERLMTELRLVTDGLAHDLRSPLGRLRTRAEQAVLAEPAAREAALGGLLAETDVVMRMLTTAIEISRSESVARDRLQPARPAELVARIADLYEPVAEDAGLVFSLILDADPPALAVHRELLSQAIANLLDNALKHAGSGGAVTLRLSAAPGEIAISVEDRGPGIAERDRAQALKRFGRLDAARSTPGAGLGMALVEAVARLHEGRFELVDHEPGLIARMVLPA
jgi:signal transduction histidine kinase